MRELAGRMRSVDPDAGAALQVIAHFDALVETRAGLEATIRAAAVLAGCPAGLVDRARRLRVRVLPDRQRADGEPTGIRSPLSADQDDAFVWLERPGDQSADKARAELDAILVERLAATVRIVLDRTWSNTPSLDPASVELLVDPAADERIRSTAARRLGLPVDGVFAVRVGIGGAHGQQQALTVRLGDLDVTIEPAGRGREPSAPRSATGPLVELRDLPLSYQQARLALRFTRADADEPGPAHVEAAALGGMLALADGCDSPAAIAEVALLDRVTSTHAWALATLTAVAAESSLRGAAVALHVHHSTLQGRVELLDRALGYSVVTPLGRTRLTVALALRRLRRNRW
ncbi:helix-turn-helix domain-containing protein [Saccharopolyspora sp. K220]|uniref:helix-turn-helix domain-containing protein n=1 Tax=Saccharopolyspora soli TaxID=2926618 RepID=UPI001F572F15|nr:helix-turn-helix domain-containing protein [Saccharopolyspora soli]MCI2417307.1 helix-turn-helix domain-containing protein [Saccharopolyspora soli]